MNGITVNSLLSHKLFSTLNYTLSQDTADATRFSHHENFREQKYLSVER